MDSYITETFTNDLNASIKIPTSAFYSKAKTNYCNLFKVRNEHEVMFRRTISYLLQNNLIKGNIVDLGAWIGDNSIPWAMNCTPGSVVYAIDPSPQNIAFIESTAALNNLQNVRAIQSAISDKNETLCTNDDLNHIQFSQKGEGEHRLPAVSLDYLETIGVLTNIGFMHLDVEGFEAKVLAGAHNILDKYKPILAIEQHILGDDYLGLIERLAFIGYNVYLINEILPGCGTDCRNFLAFPNTFRVDIEALNAFLRIPVLLSMSRIEAEKSIKTAIVYGGAMSGNVFRNVSGFKHYHKDLYLFGVHDANFTKIIATDLAGNWIEGRYFFGYVNVSTALNISNAYESAHFGEKNRQAYNIQIEKD